MNGLVVSNMVQDLVWKERERVMRGIVKLVGKMCDDVVGCMYGQDGKAVESNETYKVIDLPPPKESNVADITEARIKNIVEKTISEKFADVLQDISYRIGVVSDLIKAAEGKEHRVTSPQLNLNTHILDGYTFTNNSPSAGYVAWTDCHIVYQGNDYTVSNSNTNSKYIYWLQATPSAFQVSNTKPSLGANDVLVCVNEGGIANVVLAPGKLRPGSYLMDGTVGNNELGAGAVTSTKIAANAIFSSHITPSAITSTQLSDGAVTGSKIGAGAVATSKLNLAAHLLY